MNKYIAWLHISEVYEALRIMNTKSRIEATSKWGEKECKVGVLLCMDRWEMDKTNIIYVLI